MTALIVGPERRIPTAVVSELEVTADLLIPVSVAVRDGKIVVLLQNGTVLNGGLVAALNDLCAADRQPSHSAPVSQPQVDGVGR